MMENTVSSRTNQMVFCSLFAALVAIGAFIQVPIPYTDYFTLQTLFVILAGLLLGPKLGALSCAVYLMVGLCGAPVFAAGGGPSYILRPSFGYLIGFVAGAFVAGSVAQKLLENTFRNLLFASLAGLFFVYLIGLSYKYLLLNYYANTPTGLWVLLAACFPLDIPGDLALACAGSYLAARLRPMLRIAR